MIKNRKKVTTAEDVIDFIAECCNQAQAEGYQQFDNNPDIHIPDSWGYVDAATLHFRSGGRSFYVASRPASE